MLESGDSLRTWSLSQPVQVGIPLAARELPPHRKVYLEFEGEVSGGRGYVTREDHGIVDIISDQPDQLDFWLYGECIRGPARLNRIAQVNDQWTFLLRPEETDGQSTHP